jgi:hypothetical protein
VTHRISFSYTRKLCEDDKDACHRRADGTAEQLHSRALRAD